MASNKPPGYLLDKISATGIGAVTLDCRETLNHGLLWYQCSAESAIFNLEASPNDSAWMVVATYTATATQTGSAQIAGYFPYVRANITYVNAATAAASSATATVWALWAPVQ